MYINSNTIVNNTRKTLTLDSGHLNLKSEPSNLAQKSLNKETTLTLLKVVVNWLVWYTNDRKNANPTSLTPCFCPLFGGRN